MVFETSRSELYIVNKHSPVYPFSIQRINRFIVIKTYKFIKSKKAPNKKGGLNEQTSFLVEFE
jgi:hypothetical protein